MKSFSGMTALNGDLSNPPDDDEPAWDDGDLDPERPNWDDFDLDEAEDEPDDDPLPEDGDFWIDPDEFEDPWNCSALGLREESG